MDDVKIFREAYEDRDDAASAASNALNDALGHLKAIGYLHKADLKGGYCIQGCDSGWPCNTRNLVDLSLNNPYPKKR